MGRAVQSALSTPGEELILPGGIKKDFTEERTSQLGFEELIGVHQT